MCDLCEKRFTAKEYKERHFSAVHIENRDFKCESDMNFKSMKEREIHLETVHEGKRNFVCEFCTKQYSSKVNLELHLKNIHGMNFQW